MRRKHLFVRYASDLLHDQSGIFWRRRTDRELDPDDDFYNRDRAFDDRSLLDGPVMASRMDDSIVDRERIIERPVLEQELVDTPVVVRGGLSFWGILTGAMTALGFFLIGAAITSGFVAATDLSATDLDASTKSSLAPWVGAAFVASVFLAFLWGGYAAGRMARGTGAVNGFMVAVATLLVGAIVVALIDVLGTSATLDLRSFGRLEIPVRSTDITDAGTIVGLVALAACLLGSIMGGLWGSRWHSRLEDETIAHPRGRRIAA